MGLSTRDLSVLERGLQQSAAHTAPSERAVGGVAGRDDLTVDREGGVRAEGRRVVGALGRRGHDARESGSDEARGRGVVVLSQTAASRARAHRAGPAERADGLASAADVRREAVFGAAVGRGGRARDAVGDDKLEPGDHGVLAEYDLIDGERLRDDGG